MTKNQLNTLLHDHVPLCEFMQLIVRSLDKTHIEATAPLSPNKNMHGTGFAGSLYALAVAAGWGLVYSRLDSLNIDNQLVIKEARIHYKRPVTADITLRATLPEEMTNQKIVEQMENEKKVSFPLIIDIISKDKKCGYLEAEYVAVKGK